MAEVVITPDVCMYPDAALENMNIDIELPGVKKKDIKFSLFEEGFYVVAKKEGVKYMTSGNIVGLVDPSKAKAKYADGVLKVVVPYKRPYKETVELTIE